MTNSRTPTIIRSLLILETIAKAVISAAAHSEEHLKPIILQILSTVGMIKSEANEANPEAHTSNPEITTK